MPGRPWTHKELNRAWEMRRRGLSLAEVAAELGRNADAVGEALRRAGLGERARRLDAGAMRRLYGRGLSDGEIARRLGCSVPPVCRWRRKQGLPAHYGPGRHLPAMEAKRVAAMRRSAMRRHGAASWGEVRRWQAATAAARLWPGCRSMAEARVCLELARAGGGLWRQELLARLGVEPGTVSRALRDLLASGMLVRREERRRAHYALAPRRGPTGGGGGGRP